MVSHSIQWIGWLFFEGICWPASDGTATWTRLPRLHRNESEGKVNREGAGMKWIWIETRRRGDAETRRSLPHKRGSRDLGHKKRTDEIHPSVRICRCSVLHGLRRKKRFGVALVSINNGLLPGRSVHGGCRLSEYCMEPIGQVSVIRFGRALVISNESIFHPPAE